MCNVESRDNYVTKVLSRYVYKANSYVYVRLSDGRVTTEHRFVMECALNRQLSGNEVVHHLNGDKQDNRIENLQLISRKEHSSLHVRRVEDTIIHLTCSICKKKFTRKKNSVNRSRKRGISKAYCSRKCRAIDYPPPRRGT